MRGPSCKSLFSKSPTVLLRLIIFSNIALTAFSSQTKCQFRTNRHYDITIPPLCCQNWRAEAGIEPTHTWR